MKSYKHVLAACGIAVALVGAPIYATEKTLQNWQPGGAIYGIHYVPEGREAVASKPAYLEKALELSKTSKDGASFQAAMQAAFPDDEGAKYLDMTTKALYPAK